MIYSRQLIREAMKVVSHKANSFISRTFLYIFKGIQLNNLALHWWDSKVKCDLFPEARAVEPVFLTRCRGVSNTSCQIFICLS